MGGFTNLNSLENVSFVSKPDKDNLRKSAQTDTQGSCIKYAHAREPLCSYK